MADPFDALREPPSPLDPDPELRARLRARIERALRLPKGVTVSNLAFPDRATVPTSPIPTRAPAPPPAGVAAGTVTPYLAVAGAARAMEWYGDALGARVLGEPIVMDDGRIGHAELEIAGGRLMLSEQHPEIGVVAPAAGEGASVTIHLDVADVDRVVARAARAGAAIERPAADHPYGRNAVLRDPFGHRWMVSSPPAMSAPRPGDVGYASLWVSDVDRAAAFFAAVLGWRYAPATRPGARQVEGQTLHHGLWETAGPPTLYLAYAVDDIGSAVQRVRAAGGSAGAPRQEPYGTTADCADDQGVLFSLYESRAGGPAGPENGRRSGDLAYITMEVVDAARTRAFYGSLLGWTFSPGRVADGWQVQGPVPMIGISGGHDTATTVPMYRVDDIGEAVGAVRAAGGSSTDPERNPYGWSAACTDGRGTRFHLGQL